MKRLFLILFSVFSVSIFAETVVKNSLPFQFPVALGTISNSSAQGKDLLFSSAIRSSDRSVISLSWSLPVKAEKGIIAVFTPAGTKVKSFAIADQHGSVNWDISQNKKMANGVYFATISYGMCKKNLQLLVSR